MDELSQYLRDSFYDQRRQVEVINRLVGEVLPVFDRFFDSATKTWPYELKEEAFSPPPTYSFSTNSMILFSLAAVLGNAKETAIVPALRRAPTFKRLTGFAELDSKRVGNILDQGTEELLRQLGLQRKKKGSDDPYLTDSGTYGVDDPFTLTWIAELLRTRKEVPPDILTRVNDAAVRAIKRMATGGTILEWPENEQTRYRAQDHAFTKLRGMQLYQYLLAKRQKDKDTDAAALQAKKQKSADTAALETEKQNGDAADPAALLAKKQNGDATDAAALLAKKQDEEDTDAAAHGMAKFFEDRLHQHLSYYTVPDSRFDPAELAFCLEGALIFDKDYLGPRVIQRVFDVLSECQKANPHWRGLTPFIGTERGLALFPISVEVANSLLRSCVHVDQDNLHNTVFERFVPQLKRYADWLQARLVRGKNSRGKFSGWHSEHLEEPGTIHLWETSQVIIYLMHYAALLQEQAARTALLKSRLSVIATVVRGVSPYRLKDAKLDDLRKQDAETYWQEYVEGEWEPLLSGTETDSVYRTFEVIRRKYIQPRSQLKPVDRYTILLSGPPGTGKTTFCKSLAATLKWRFINITVSDFLAGGAAEVEARAKAIFEMLNEQTNTVILMDEIDNFLLDRESRRYETQQGIFQFMTPGMLTKLNDFREQEASILVVATNYAERIDAAIQRTGRFDDRLLLLPPGKDRRRKMVDTILTEAKDNDKISHEAKAFDSLKMDELSRITVLLSYGELRRIVDAVLKKLDSKSDVATIANGLIEAAKNVRPTISLLSYRTRIQAQLKKVRNRAPDRAAPVEEFLLLTYLLKEAERIPDPDEGLLIADALRILGDGAKLPSADQASLVEAFTSNGVRDIVIAKRLAEAVVEWGIIK